MPNVPLLVVDLLSSQSGSFGLSGGFAQNNLIYNNSSPDAGTLLSSIINKCNDGTYAGFVGAAQGGNPGRYSRVFHIRPKIPMLVQIDGDYSQKVVGEFQEPGQAIAPPVIFLAAPAVWYAGAELAFAQLLLFLLNGPSSVFDFLIKCPCYNTFNDSLPLCYIDNTGLAFSLWGLASRNLTFDPDGKSGTTTPFGPCMDPGKTMVVSVGSPPFYSGSAQVVRIRNLDKIFFDAVNSIPKSCTQSLAITFSGGSCALLDELYGKTTAVQIDLSIQFQVLGNDVFANQAYACDTEPPVQPYQDCSTTACLTVTVPSIRFFLTLDVPLVKETKFDVGCLKLQAGNYLAGVVDAPGYILDWAKTNVTLNFALDEAPVFDLPSVPAAYQNQVQSLIMQVINTSMQQAIDTMLDNFLQKEIRQLMQGLAAITDNVPICVVFPAFTPITCVAGQVPVIPANVCNPCDYCCICITSGSCSEECQAKCPCITQFCNSVKRTDNFPWWQLFILIVLIIIGGVLFQFFSLRGVNVGS